MGADRESAAAGAFGVVGFGAVLIEQEDGAFGVVLELFGSDAGGGADQVDLDLGAGQGVDRWGDGGHGVADHLHVFGVDHSVCAGRGGGRQHRVQGLSGQALAWCQGGGLGEAVFGLAAGEAPADGEHVAPALGAHGLRCGLGLQPGQQSLALGG